MSVNAGITSCKTNSATFAQTRQDFGVLSGTRPSTELMENYLAAEHSAGATFERALKLALDAWTVGHLALGDAGVKELPARDKIVAERKERLRAAGFTASRYHADPVLGEDRPFADEVNGVHYYDNLAVGRTATMPSVLVEAGVVVNREEDQRMRDPLVRSAIARAIGEGARRCLN